jgi:predicted DNA-binding transcriptional regulator YafY
MSEKDGMLAAISGDRDMSSNANDTLMRLLEMLRLIPRAPRKTSVQELHRLLMQRGYPTSLRTIERDLQNLSRRFDLVSDESSKPYGWSWAKDAQAGLMPRLSTPQAVALLLSQAHLKHFMPQFLLKELAPVFASAEQEVASTGMKDWHRHTAIIPSSMPLLPPKLSADVLENVHAALARRRCLSGRYRARGSKTDKELVIHPLGLLVRGAVQYLVCTLKDYKDVRQLALHRLSHTYVLELPCTPLQGFDFSSYAASNANKYWAQGKIALIARFTAEAAGHLRETPVSKDQELIDQEDGRVELRATVERDDTLRWWLLGFGNQVEVLAPETLRMQMGEELLSAARRYAGKR